MPQYVKWSVNFKGLSKDVTEGLLTTKAMVQQRLRLFSDGPPTTDRLHLNLPVLGQVFGPVQTPERSHWSLRSSSPHSEHQVHASGRAFLQAPPLPSHRNDRISLDYACPPPENLVERCPRGLREWHSAPSQVHFKAPARSVRSQSVDCT